MNKFHNKSSFNTSMVTVWDLHIEAHAMFEPGFANYTVTNQMWFHVRRIVWWCFERENTLFWMRSFVCGELWKEEIPPNPECVVIKEAFHSNVKRTIECIFMNDTRRHLKIKQNSKWKQSITVILSLCISPPRSWGCSCSWCSGDVVVRHLSVLMSHQHTFHLEGLERSQIEWMIYVGKINKPEFSDAIVPTFISLKFNWDPFWFVTSSPSLLGLLDVTKHLPI